MIIINQSGTAMFNFDNAIRLEVSGKFIKLTLSNALKVANEEQVGNISRFPNIVIAEYETEEKALKVFESFIARVAITNLRVWQMPEK